MCYSFLLLLCLLPNVFPISVWEAYHSDDQRLRREGMLNTRFRPVLHLRGEDDYRTLQQQEPLFKDEDVDENGVFLPRTSWNNRAFRKNGMIQPGMHFDSVVDTPGSRIHFIVNRADETIISHFTRDGKTLHFRGVSANPVDCDPDVPGFGESVFGNTEQLLDNRTECSRGRKTGFPPVLVENVQGSSGDKFYYADYSSHTLSRLQKLGIDGVVEHTVVPKDQSITRFLDSEYILCSKRESAEAAIYQWRTGREAEFIRNITIPADVMNYRRMAYGSSIIFYRSRVGQTRLTVYNVLTGRYADKTIPYEIKSFTCSNNYIFTVSAGKIIFVEIDSLTVSVFETNLNPSTDYSPIAIDKNGFVYLACEIQGGSQILRAENKAFESFVECRIVIPKQLDIGEPEGDVEREDPTEEEHARVDLREQVPATSVLNGDTQSHTGFHAVRPPPPGPGPSQPILLENLTGREEEVKSTEEILQEEMEWLKGFLNGNIAAIQRDNDRPMTELEKLQKKYARLLMMMARSDAVKK